FSSCRFNFFMVFLIPNSRKQETKREFECSYELKKENAELCRINTELRKDFNEAIAQKVNLALALMGGRNGK
ncbi:hypothetical protein, partial [Paramuribaculum intestinale]|uniref:hypothetical protein n=1 Tax=Paramuribaculum intestinale TaxID=2094151 RepID=UPI0026763FA8